MCIASAGEVNPSRTFLTVSSSSFESEGKPLATEEILPRMSDCSASERARTLSGSSSVTKWRTTIGCVAAQASVTSRAGSTVHRAK